MKLCCLEDFWSFYLSPLYVCRIRNALKVHHSNQFSLTGRKEAQRDTGWAPQAIKSTTTNYGYHPKTWKNRKGQKRPLKNSRWRIGFAKQSQSFTMDWLCKAKPIHQNGLALRSKANPSLKKALRSKAHPSWWKGFAKQSQSIMKDWLCEAKKLNRNILALRSKANFII